jgi:hypothetical protein
MLAKRLEKYSVRSTREGDKCWLGRKGTPGLHSTLVRTAHASTIYQAKLQRACYARRSEQERTSVLQGILLDQHHQHCLDRAWRRRGRYTATYEGRNARRDAQSQWDSQPTTLEIRLLYSARAAVRLNVGASNISRVNKSSSQFTASGNIHRKEVAASATS